MKTTCEILVHEHHFQNRERAHECFQVLAKAVPAGMKNRYFHLQVAPDAPEIEKTLVVLERFGLRRPQNAWQKPSAGFISIKYDREFEESDLASARYLQVWPQEDIAAGQRRTMEGLLRFKLASRKPLRLSGVSSWIVLTEQVRQLMFRQGFHHIEFRRCLVEGDGSEAYDDTPIWELTSDLTLPPLSPQCKLCDCYGGNQITDPDKGCTIDDGLYLPVQLRYTESALRSVEPFDVALTKELFGFQLQHHWLAVSQRFYQFCVQQQFKLFWVPVRIDPE